MGSRMLGFGGRRLRVAEGAVDKGAEQTFAHRSYIPRWWDLEVWTYRSRDMP